MRRYLFFAIALIFCASVLFFLRTKLFKTSLPGYLKDVAGQKYNVLLITIDTLRADRLGAYGFKEINTPNIDSLAKDGILFEDATAHVPLTLPSHTSIMTGLFPSNHGVHDNGGFHVSSSQQTIAEILKQNGFRTGAFVGAFVLDSSWGLNQGFDTYFDHFELPKEERVGLASIQRNADDVYKNAKTWLDQHQKERFFLWVHFYDPHTPYEPPEAYDHMYPGRPYIAEIAYTDSVVGKLLSHIKQIGVRDKTVILLSGDHGESLGEHRESTHAFFIYDATLDVPMILSIPDHKFQGKRISKQARLVDIMPTLLQLAGAVVPENIQGRSLLHYIFGSENAQSPASYAECYYPQYHFGWSRLLSLRDGAYKYIDSSKPELYDLKSDPGELKNLYSQKHDIAARMKAELKKIENAGLQAAMQPGAIDDETHEKLASLGYVGAFGGAVESDPEKLPDPKDKIDLFNMMSDARDDALEGKSDEAIQKLNKMLALDPKIVDGYFLLGNEYYKTARYAEAIDAFKKALELKPDYDFAVINLANTYRKMGKIDDALLGFEYFLKKNPDNVQVLARIGELQLARNDPDEAMVYFDRALKIDPKTSWVYNSKGAALLQKHQIPEAEAAFKKALELNPKINWVHFNLAQVYETRGSDVEAQQEYLKELEIAPKNYKASFNLGRSYLKSGKSSESINYFQKAVSDAPDFGLGYLYLAQAYLEVNDLVKAAELANTGLSKDLDKSYKPLAHYILADVYNRQGRHELEQQELRLAEKSKN
jgi:arylsulfatase A-like enzyme/Tfp pilus assembly protein PilF